ncbi:hypothetical protein QR680_000501 [Steinernema hermaphroditum]|uniref:Insulin-like domain-containing protein n=1 Tax=Steinernema hermaphroditum TaxID=289476 RepID=A0AA39LDP7_9BILA|nr:hypothetical protein QR680_000501 [Steinernema hermaphroditum]
MSFKAALVVFLATVSLASSLSVCVENEDEWELVFDGCNPTPLPCVKSHILRAALKGGQHGRGGVRRCCGNECRIEEIRVCPENDTTMKSIAL